MEIKLNDKVTVDLSSYHEGLVMSWLVFHHDYDEIKIGRTHIQCKWLPCEDGSHYKDGEHGKYVYDINYPVYDDVDGYLPGEVYHLENLTDVELDTEAIMAQIGNIPYSSDFYADIVAVKHNYNDQNVRYYTNKPVTRVLCPLENASAKDSGLILFLDENNEPLVAYHGNIIYSDIKFIGFDEMSDAKIYNLRSGADDKYIRLEMDETYIYACRH